MIHWQVYKHTNNFPYYQNCYTDLMNIVSFMEHHVDGFLWSCPSDGYTLPYVNIPDIEKFVFYLEEGFII